MEKSKTPEIENPEKDEEKVTISSDKVSQDGELVNDKSEDLSESPFESIVEGIEDNIPELSEHVINSEKIDVNPDIQPLSQQNDGFNPDLHRVDENGKPIITKKGKFAFKPGKKPNSSSNTNNSNSNIGGVGSQAITDTNSQNKIFAVLGAESVSTIRHDFSNNILPKFDEGLKNAWATAIENFLDEKEMEMSSTTTLCVLTVSSVVVPLATLPPENNKLLNLYSILSQKISSFIYGDQVPEMETRK